MPFTDLEVVMKSLLDDGKYADMKISCQEHDFKCHRAVICSQSPFFDAALKNGFKEAKSSQVNLLDEDVDTIACILSFCYLQDYGQADDSQSFQSDKTARNHLGVYIAADKFGIFPLRELAFSRIVGWARSNWSKEYFPGIVQDIWRDTPPHENKLCDEIVEVISTNILHFQAQDDGYNVLVENDDLMLAVLERVAANYAEVKEQNNRLIEQKNSRSVRRAFAPLK